MRRPGRLVLGAIGLLVLGALIAGRARGGHDTSAAAAVTTAGPVTTHAAPGTPVPAGDPGGGQAPGTTATTRPGVAPASLPPGPLSDAELIRAADAASRFAVAYATWRFDEPPAAAARLAGLATDEFAAELARGSSAAAARTGQHEVAVAQPAEIRLRLIAPDSVVAVVAVRQTVTGTTGRATQLRWYAVTVVKVGGRWAASAIADAGDGDTGG